MNKQRCSWCNQSEIYQKYHDEEWGVPLYDEQKLIELFMLETQQAGLSWITVLNKRETYREAFDDFDIEKIALYDEQKITDLMQNRGLIRNRLKINAIIHNAKLLLDLKKENISFVDLIWEFVDGKPINHAPKTKEDVPVTTEISDKMSKYLKKLGFKFVGSTTLYAFMQAAGLVNDHQANCFKYQE